MQNLSDYKSYGSQIYNGILISYALNGVTAGLVKALDDGSDVNLVGYRTENSTRGLTGDDLVDTEQCNEVTRKYKNFSLLHLAALNGHTETVKLLLDRGANLHFQTPNGDTALDLAVKDGHTKTVELLLEKGAVPRLHGYFYNSPIDSTNITVVELYFKQALKNTNLFIDEVKFKATADDTIKKVQKSLEDLLSQFNVQDLPAATKLELIKQSLNTIDKLDGNFEHKNLAGFIFKRLIQTLFVLPIMWVLCKGELFKTNSECKLDALRENMQNYETAFSRMTNQ